MLLMKRNPIDNYRCSLYLSST